MTPGGDITAADDIYSQEQPVVTHNSTTHDESLYSQEQPIAQENNTYDTPISPPSVKYSSGDQSVSVVAAAAAGAAVAAPRHTSTTSSEPKSPMFLVDRNASLYAQQHYSSSVEPPPPEPNDRPNSSSSSAASSSPRDAIYVNQQQLLQNSCLGVDAAASAGERVSNVSDTYGIAADVIPLTPPRQSDVSDVIDDDVTTTTASPRPTPRPRTLKQQESEYAYPDPEFTASMRRAAAAAARKQNQTLPVTTSHYNQPFHDDQDPPTRERAAADNTPSSGEYSPTYMVMSPSAPTTPKTQQQQQEFTYANCPDDGKLSLL